MSEQEFWQTVHRAQKLREAAEEKRLPPDTLAQQERRAFLMVAKAVEKREQTEPALVSAS